MRNLPIQCPSCSEPLLVSELSCSDCETVISGKYPLPKWLQLPLEDQEFILQFVFTSGSLKKMAIKMGISYPTVRNRLDDIIEKLNIQTSL
ncbi:DUF2089 family protein [Pricia sp.]|uniref:DUF2089 family protein n=1 Tax=Pricia sp. TaxID=2268138 RepID=UPI003593B821